jgi:glucan phosphoethanolaminetransferase (alkaline phosphatase superfamily)
MRKAAVHFTYNLALLFTLPVVFIVVYVWLYFNPSIVIYQHLSAIALFIFSILSIKLLINHYFNHQKLVLFVGTILYSSFIFGLIVYYALVLISLNSWSRVITEEFILAYAGQAKFFLEALGVSYHLIIVALVIAYALIAIICYFFLKKFHWLPSKYIGNTWIIGPLLFCICLFFIAYTNEYIIHADPTSKEPIKLTLFSGKPKAKQDHSAKLGYSSDIKLNVEEDNARKNYIVSPSTKKRNLIVIMVDGLRPDHTSAYGYQKDTTPFLKKLITNSSSHIFTNVRSVCAETTCAHAGFMGSRFVHDLPDSPFTLQDVLKRNGYHTNFIISGDHLSFNNIRDIYGKVDEYYDGTMAKGYYFNDDEIVVNKTKSLPDWNGKPTMIHYHLLSAHLVGKKYPKYKKFLPANGYGISSDMHPKLDYSNFYDNGVLQADAIINELMLNLKQKQYLENTLVVITSDHGEALGEHNFFTHTNSVIEEVLNVPLVMVSYGYKSKLPKKHVQFMSLADLSPTILHEFDIKIPETWTGIASQLNTTRPFTFFEMPPYKGLYDHRDTKVLWKYWKNFNTDEEFVFNLSKDPGENNNLVWQTPNHQIKQWRETLAATNQ